MSEPSTRSEPTARSGAPEGSRPASGPTLNPPLNKGVWGRRLVGLVILAAAVYLMHRLVADIGWPEVRSRLGEARLALAAAGAACVALQFTLWAVRMRIAVRRVVDTPPGWVVFLSLLATAAANFLIPFARLVGGLLRARYLSQASRPTTPKRVFYGAVLFDQTVHLAVMGGMTLVALVTGSLLLGRPVLAGSIALALAVAAVLATLWVRRRASGREGVVASFIRLLERLARGKEGAAGTFFSGSEAAAKIYFRLLADGSLWWRTLGLGAGLFLALASAQWLSFLALGEAIDPLLVVVTLALGLSAGVLLGTPGGLGTTEATMIALYAALGVDGVDAASAVLLFRGLQYAVVLGLGLPAMVLLELHTVALPGKGSDRPSD